MKRPTISVVIATYKRHAVLDQCLKALSNQSDSDFEVIVLSGEKLTSKNNPTKKVLDSYKRTLRIQVLIDEIPELSYIRDQLWRAASGEIVAAIDDDVVVDTTWIAAIRRAFTRNPKLAGVSGPTTIPASMLNKRDVFMLHRSDNIVVRMLSKLYVLLFMHGEYAGIGTIYPSGAWSPGSNFPEARTLKKPIAVDYLEACNYAIRKRVLEEIHGYDYGYIKTSEWCEVDVSFRIRKQGYELLFDPAVSVEHRVSRSGVYTRRNMPWHRIYNFIRFYHRTYYPKSIVGYMQFLLYLGFICTYYALKVLRLL